MTELESAYVPTEDDLVDNEKFDEVEVEKARNELKENDSEPRVKEVITTDALSGTVISSKNEYDGYDEIDKECEKTDIRGKSIAKESIEDIEKFTGVKLSDGDSKRIAEYFENLVSSEDIFETVDFDEIKNILGDNLVEAVSKLSTDENQTEAICRRMISQIYSCYRSAITYNDDIRELNMIARNIKISTDKSKNTQEDFDEESDDFSKALEDLEETNKWISAFIDKKINIDNRNRKLRQDYCIDDIDAHSVEDIKNALDDALNMVTLNKILEVSGSRYYNEYKNERERATTIKNWISDVKNDTTTFYTLPTNDYNTVAVATKEVLDYIYNALLAEQFKDFPVPTNEYDIEKYYLENGIAQKEDVEKIRSMSQMLLFVIAKTFKIRKLKNEYNRRILSYTLDMLGKLGRDNYRERIYTFANTCYEYLS